MIRRNAQRDARAAEEREEFMAALLNAIKITPTLTKSERIYRRKMSANRAECLKKKPRI